MTTKIEPLTVTVTLEGEDAEFVRRAADMMSTSDAPTALLFCVQATMRRMKRSPEAIARQLVSEISPILTRLLVDEVSAQVRVRDVPPPGGYTAGGEQVPR